MQSTGAGGISLPTLRARVVATWLLAAAALVALIVIHSVTIDTLTGDATYALVNGGAGTVGLLAVRRHSRGRRLAWTLVCSGVLLSALGDTTYAAYHWSNGSIPDVSLADVFWLSSYVVLFLGVLRLLAIGGRTRRVDIDGMLDMGAVAVVATMVIMQSNAFDVIGDDTIRPLVRVVWAAYPILDVALVAVVARAIVSRRTRSLAGALLAAGAVCWLVSDFAYMLLADPAATWLMDAGWMVGSATIVAAAWCRPVERDVDDELALEQVGKASVLLGLLPFLAPWAILLWAHSRGRSPNPTPMFVSTALLTAFAFIRTMRMSRVSVRNQRRVQTSQRYYSALAEHSSDAVVVVDANRRIITDTPRLAELLGYAGTPTLGIDLLQLVHIDDAYLATVAFQQSLDAPGRVHELELRLNHADGEVRWLSARSINLLDDPDVAGVVVNIHDVTDRKVAEEQLSHQAFHDTLTGLANRSLFHDRVEHALRRHARVASDVALVYLDLDGFKGVNDSLGHEAGDAVLRETAIRLAACVRSSDTVARLGGDEFAILVERSYQPFDEAAAIAERVLDALRVPIEVADQLVIVTGSLGIALGDEHSSGSSLLRDADVAMYRAKATGKARWVVYDPAMRVEVVERRQLENDLLHALELQQFDVMYQPIIELESERIVGFEALLRWHHPELGLVGPDRFIPILEDNGLIVPVGSWVLERACQQAVVWRDRHAWEPNLTMAVNLSTRQISWPDLVSDVQRVLDTTGLAPASLVLEMTETALVQDAGLAAQRLHELRELGVRIAVDDFGTGYSSLSYLRQFPIDILKIDRSFVNTITDKTQIPAIVRGLLDLGKTLELETIAEGIELGVQRDRLVDEDCRLGQGFLFSRPISAADAGDLLAKARQRA